MPPKVSRKRALASSPAPPAKRQATTKATGRSGKTSLYDAIDDRTAAKSTPEQTKAYIDQLQDSDDSSLSDADSDEFEDVPAIKSCNGEAKHIVEHEDDDDDEMDWEDAIQGADNQQAAVAPPGADDDIGDLSISLQDDGTVVPERNNAGNTLRKGPSKRERQVRNGTHCIHVQALMWHNAIRNTWLNDKELQKILVDGLSEGVKNELDRWREDMGMPVEVKQGKGKTRGKGKKGAKSKGKDDKKRDGRDWGIDADRLEKGAINMSRGDPLLRLLKILTAYWRKRFTITTPGLRKQGYMPIKRLAEETRAWKKNMHNAEDYGERIEGVKDLRKLAKACEGSRDVGSQLFTALLRGLGLEVRMVANLQPAGIGWGKNEEAKPKRTAKAVAVDEDLQATDAKTNGKSPGKKKTPTPSKSKKPSRKSDRTPKQEVISLDSDSDGDSGLSSPPSDIDDDASIIDVTPDVSNSRPGRKYDRDLSFPHYWTEVLSPISNTFIPVDPIILSTVATNAELLATFEPRGKRADQSKQVICYTVAHSPDGSAKDVTVRYLKRHQFPGRAKSFRMPMERIKVHNRRGKVLRYEEYDWFKTVMSNFARPAEKRTEADDLEESTDLKPFKPADDKPKVEQESLQWYKQSAEFVLERHLRREEAISIKAKPVKTFMNGKGDKATDEPVYLRKDVVACKTAESWHKEGRQIKVGEQPLKLVNMRAVTTTRKREIEEIERETGEKAKQGLFGKSQTEWIIPPPIGSDRQIPINAFGNIDVYTSSMVPKGAIHIPLKGTARICKDLKISFAEACTGFEFGKRMAIPVLTGVVVAEENENAVIDAWQIREAERKRKEDAKREQANLQLWRKFVMGMRIIERMRSEYAGSGSTEEEINPFVNKAKQRQREDESAPKSKTKHHDAEEEDDMAGGGFMRPGEDDEEDEKSMPDNSTSAAQDDADMDTGGGFMLDSADDAGGGQIKSAAAATVTPMSLQSAAQRKIKVDESEENSEEEEQAPKKTGSARKVNPASRAHARKSASKPSPAPKRKQILVETKAESAETSELSEVSSEAESSTAATTPPATRISSPKAIVTPGKGRTRGRNSAKTKTRVTSPYFRNGSANEESDHDDNEGNEDSEQEVVKPRMTTARTRGRT